MFSQKKMDCRLVYRGRTVEGLAHVAEVKFREDIQFCSFVMNVTSDQNLGMIVGNERDAELILPDGRRSKVTLTRIDVAVADTEIDDTELAGTGIFVS